VDFTWSQRLNQIFETDGGDGFVEGETLETDEHVGETVLDIGKGVKEDLSLRHITHD